MAIVLGVFAVWLVRSTLEPYVTAPKWAWYLLMALFGIGWQLLVEPSQWWLGIGIGGAAAALVLVTDLLLVLADWARVAVLRRSR